MRILFILKEAIMNERLGVMCLSSALKAHGHDVRFVLADSVGIKGLKKLMSDYIPDIVGYSAMTGEHVKLLEVNRVLKESYKFLTVFGGPHATFFPELINEEGCDAACIGEGETVFAEFCRRLDNNEAYWQTPNFIVKYNGGIIRNPVAPLIENLDELLFPDRDLMYEADPSLRNEVHKRFFSTRGCPYKCTYCFNNKYNEKYKGKGSVLRHRSPENMIAEICSVRDNHSMGLVLIDDDTFNLKPEGWIETFCRLYKKEVKLPLSCNFRANLVVEEEVAMLKDAGLDSVWMAIECGNEDVANRVLNRNLSNEQLLTACKIIKKHGIKLITQNMVGMPVKNSYRTDLETLDLNFKVNPTFAWSSILYPYPGTPVAEDAQKNGFIDEEIPFFETNKCASVLNFSKDEKKQIEHLHKLFGLIVSFPFLRKFCRLLCNLPLTGLYKALFYLWYGYNMKVKIYPFVSLRKELAGYIHFWWRFIRRT